MQRQNGLFRAPPTLPDAFGIGPTFDWSSSSDSVATTRPLAQSGTMPSTTSRNHGIALHMRIQAPHTSSSDSIPSAAGGSSRSSLIGQPPVFFGSEPTLARGTLGPIQPTLDPLFNWATVLSPTPSLSEIPSTNSRTSGRLSQTEPTVQPPHPTTQSTSPSRRRSRHVDTTAASSAPQDISKLSHLGATQFYQSALEPLGVLLGTTSPLVHSSQTPASIPTTDVAPTPAITTLLQTMRTPSPKSSPATGRQDTTPLGTICGGLFDRTPTISPLEQSQLSVPLVIASPSPKYLLPRFDRSPPALLSSSDLSGNHMSAVDTGSATSGTSYEHVNTMPLDPRYTTETSITAAMPHSPSLMMRSASKGKARSTGPLFRPESPVTSDIEEILSPMLGSTSKRKTPPTSVSQVPGSRRRRTQIGTLVIDESESDGSGVDEELARAYGIELKDTGFQSDPASSGAKDSTHTPNKTRLSKAPSKVPRQVHGATSQYIRTNNIYRLKKSVPFGTTWAGGPGGALKFNAKPEGFVDGIDRWSFSEDGPTSANVTERLVGDLHFSPTTQFLPDDDPFTTWVVVQEHNGLLRWVQFLAGQPHPRYKGFVLKPAQLPRTPPRWLKENSYKYAQSPGDN